MRIGLVGPTYPFKGGVALHTTVLAHRLADAGHDVVLESWSRQYPARLYPGRQHVEVPETQPFPRTRRDLSWARPDSWWRAGRRLARDCDLVVVVVVTPVQAPAYLGVLAGARGGRRPTRVALVHNVLPHERRAVDRMLMRAVLSRCDALLVHSGEQAALARSLVDRPVTVAALPAHLPDGATSAEPGAAPHRRLLFFGIVRPYKGLDVLLQALARVPDVALTVAGEFWGGTEPTERLVADLGLTARVQLRPGYVAATDLPGLFASADAVVLPYRSATASQNVSLAFAYGLPVIVTTAGALADGVTDGVDGLTCRPGDPADLAAAIERFYAPGEAQRLRAGVRAPDPAPAWAVYVAALVATAGAAGVPGGGA